MIRFSESRNPTISDCSISMSLDAGDLWVNNSTGGLFVCIDRSGIWFPIQRAGGAVTLATPVWDDFTVTLTSATKANADFPGLERLIYNGVSSRGVFVYAFSATAEEELYFVAQMPHRMKFNTAIYPHIHWCPMSTGTAGHTVCWGLEYTWFDVGGTAGNTAILSSITHSPADSVLVTNKHYVTSWPAISGGGQGVSSVLACRVFRDATGALKTDSYTADAAALSVDFHFEVDSLGSTSEFVK